MSAPPHSPCDGKGRCLRHPTIQMSRKKKLGGWKTLMSRCPMCAMELISADGSSAARTTTPPPSDSVSLHSGGGPSSSSSRPRRRAPQVGHHDHRDDGSVAELSVRSAPSAYGDCGRGRRRSASKRGDGFQGSDSSCDTTADMSHSSEYSLSSGNSNGAGNFSPHGGRRPAHSGPAHGSAHGSGSAGRRPPTRRDQRQSPIEEQFVCGMELTVENDRRCFYTGQIHVESRLPHGLGTLRSEGGDGTMLEGEWRFGRLVAPPAAPVSRGHSRGYQDAVGHPERLEGEEEYSEEYRRGGEYRREEYADHCPPRTSAEGRGRSNRESTAPYYEESSLCDDFRRECQVPNSEDSSIADSVAETIHDDDSESRGSSVDSTGDGSYSARESKSSLPPAPFSGAGATRRESREHWRHVKGRDREGDYRRDDDRARPSYSRRCADVVGEHERPRRVRFREDP